MCNLVYLVYGNGLHLKELEFSLLSAVHCNGGTMAGLSVTIFTDAPVYLSDISTRIEIVSADQMGAWAGPHRFGLRGKVQALATALRLLNSPCLFVDTDTYFLKSPGEVYERITSRESVMHVMEGHVCQLAAVGPVRKKLDHLTIDVGTQRPYEFEADTRMWNSGIVGIHPDNTYLFDEILNLCDGLQEMAPSWISEQLAFSRVLERHTRVRGCRDAIFHYHPRDLKEPFRRDLPAFLDRCSSQPLPQRAASLFEMRPRARRSKVCKAVVKRALKRVGLFEHDLETSV